MSFAGVDIVPILLIVFAFFVLWICTALLQLSVLSGAATPSYRVAHQSRKGRGLVICSILILLLCSWASPIPRVSASPASSEGKDEHLDRLKRGNISLPVLYLTDRQQLDEKKNYGAKRKYIVDCKHHMYYGTAAVVVADKHGKLSEKLSRQLNWQAENKLHRGDVSCDKIHTGSPENDKSEFFSRLQQALDASGADKICIFVHGAEDSFNDAAGDAASLAYSLEMPLIMYSWPSNPKA